MTTRRKKILWLCSWYPGKTEPFNGDFIQRHARAAALHNDIFVIHVIGDNSGSVRNTEEERKNEDGLTEQLIYFPRSTTFLGKIIAQYRLLKLYRNAVRQYIAANGKPDAVHVHIPFKAGLAALWARDKLGIPFIVTEHWGIYNDVLSDNYNSRGKIFRSSVKTVISKASKLISVSRYLAEGINRMVVKKEYTVIENVVDTTLFYPVRKEKGISRFIHVSNMVPLKNAEGIVRAFRLLLEKGNEAELVMVGDTKPDIRKYADSLHFPPGAVVFKGEIAYREVALEMQQADCLVLFSNIENSPCVIGEALCCGLPVITTPVGGIPELVDSSDALIVDVGKEELLAEAMENMIKGYSTYDKNKIAEQARGRFSYSIIGEKMDAVYTSIQA